MSNTGHPQDASMFSVDILHGVGAKLNRLPLEFSRFLVECYHLYSVVGLKGICYQWFDLVFRVWVGERDI